MSESKQQPWVLTIGGHDPTGGAGIQADMETLLSFGCRPASVITCLTRQDTHNVRAISPMAPDDVIGTLDCLLDDLGTPDAIKTGLIGDATLADVIGKHLAELNTPIIVDPVLAAGGGKDLSNQVMVEAMRSRLVSIATIATPNLAELARLVPEEAEAQSQANRLLTEGCHHLLVTGGDADTEQVENRYFGPGSMTQAFLWPRINGPRHGQFHGTGCTLASAIAALLAQGEPMIDSVQQAQGYVAETLENAMTPGTGQAIPHRLFWAER